jgi:hypothetical protein
MLHGSCTILIWVYICIWKSKSDFESYSILLQVTHNLVPFRVLLDLVQILPHGLESFSIFIWKSQVLLDPINLAHCIPQGYPVVEIWPPELFYAKSMIQILSFFN